MEGAASLNTDIKGTTAEYVHKLVLTLVRRKPSWGWRGKEKAVTARHTGERNDVTGPRLLVQRL